MHSRTSRSSMPSGRKKEPTNHESLPKHISTCPKCDVINVCESHRIICPYCGAFYDPKNEKIYARNNATHKNGRRFSLVI